MDFGRIATNGMVLLGCGKMGSAMLAGWLDGGLAASSVTVLDPYPSDWLKSLDGLRLNTALPDAPALVLIAVKPQMMEDALPRLQALGNGETLFVSVAAGTSIATYAEILGDAPPVIRAMPNTPAAVARGITAVIGNAHTSSDHLSLARTLLSAVGEVVDLEDEAQLDAVTGLSGSGPAYVFHLIEAMAAAGEAQGLAAELAMKLAQATVSGAGELARVSDETAAQLRVNVTSPNGTTAAGLEVLMNETDGLQQLMRATVAAAADRSRELSK